MEPELQGQIVRLCTPSPSYNLTNSFYKVFGSLSLLHIYAKLAALKQAYIRKHHIQKSKRVRQDVSEK